MNSDEEVSLMKYPMIAIMVVALLAVGGFYFYSQNQSTSDSMIKKDEVVMEKKEESMEKTDSKIEGSDSAMDKSETDDKMTAEGKGEYVEYSQSAYESASAKKRVLYFYANWCPTCKPLDAQLKANMDKIPAGVVILRVNYNDTDTDATDKALAQKYGITYQHTFVQVDDEGNEIAKWNGGGLDKIISSIK